MLNLVKTRAYAARGDEHACRRHIELAEHTHTDASGSQGWLATAATPALLYAGTGHAAATLARRTNSTDARREALVRLDRAIDLLDPTTQARTTALCLAQLATLHFEASELDQAIPCGARLVEIAGGIRSARLTGHLTALRRSTEQHHDPAVKQLTTDLDNMLGPAGADR